MQDSSSSSPHPSPGPDPGNKPGLDPQDPIHAQGISQVPPTPPPGYIPMYPAPARGRSWQIVGRVFFGLLSAMLVISIMLNLYLGAYFASSMTGPIETPRGGTDSTKRIVILPIRGLIDGKTAAFVRQALESLRNKPPAALLLRIESGGGGVSASDQIWHMLKMFKEETAIPIVASFGSMAASGGYYIASIADHIVAEPTTITGSIGVIAQAFTVERLLDKIGVTPEVIVSTQSTRKDSLSPFRAWKDQDRTELRSILDEAYDRFVWIVTQGRKDLSDKEVRRLATGEPFTCTQALKNKLVDSQGYLASAVEQAKKLAHLPSDADPEVTEIHPANAINLLSLMTGHHRVPESLNAENIQRWLTQMAIPRLAYRMPPAHP